MMKISLLPGEWRNRAFSKFCEQQHVYIFIRHDEITDNFTCDSMEEDAIIVSLTGYFYE